MFQKTCAHVKPTNLSTYADLLENISSLKFRLLYKTMQRRRATGQALAVK
jgi:hypothetical protein